MKVRLSDAAKAELLAHTAWLYERSLTAGDAAEAAIYEAVDLLALFPRCGKECGDGTRELPAPFGQSGYILRYEILDDHILIRRIFHMRQDRR